MFEKRENISQRRLELKDKFPFLCHPGLACFNSCCRDKRLYLYPYDLLRLRRALNLTSDQLLEEYVAYEVDPESGWPLFLLKLDDEGCCRFVTEKGCSIYEHRPSCCRNYPLARALTPVSGGEIREIIYVIDPNYCNGWDQDIESTLEQWLKEQQVEEYRKFNNRLSRFFMHPARPSTIKLTEEQLRAIIVALYNLDVFREIVRDHQFGKHFNFTDERIREALEKDEALLELGQDWLTMQFFG